MALTLAQIRSMLRSLTGHDSTTLPDDDTGDIIGVNTFMNRAWWNMINKLDLKNNESTATFDTVDGTGSYASPVSNMEAARVLSYNDPDTNRQVVLIQKDLKWYRENQDNNSFSQDKPLYYINDGSNIILVPVPDKVYTINVDHWSILDDASISGINAPRETGEIIQYGAAWRIFADINGNVNKASYYKNLETTLLQEYTPQKSREEEDLSTAGLDFLGRDYD